MKNFGKMLKTVCFFCLVMMLLCSFAYPLLLTGVSQVTMQARANGSLIDKNGNLTTDLTEAVGSELLGQNFTEDCFFKGRVSAVNYNTYTKEDTESGVYPGVASGSFNYGSSNPDLKARIEEDLDVFLAAHLGVTAAQVPADLLTASGSGLDPHISPQAAEIQIASVAEHSGLSEETVEKIVEENTEHKVLGIFGEERVNVLKCNLAVARAMAQ